MNDRDECVICHQKNILVTKGSLTMNLEKIDNIPESSITWKIFSICRECYPTVTEKLNALYEEIIDDYGRN